MSTRTGTGVRLRSGSALFVVGEGVYAIRANFNETPTGEETFLTLRYIARSFEPEPVTVIGIVIVVDWQRVGPLTSHCCDADVDDQIDLYENF